MNATIEAARRAETEALRMARDGASTKQIFERTGVNRERLEKLLRDFPAAPRPQTPRPAPESITAEELESLLRHAIDQHPATEPTELAFSVVRGILPQQRPAVLIRALELLLRTLAAPTPPVPQPAVSPPRPITSAPSRKTGIVKDLVQARLEARVVVDGRRLRFAECTRDQVLALHDETRTAAETLISQCVWLHSVAEAMLVHRAATVAELPAGPRAELMRGKPE